MNYDEEQEKIGKLVRWEAIGGGLNIYFANPNITNRDGKSILYTEDEGKGFTTAFGLKVLVFKETTL